MIKELLTHVLQRALWEKNAIKYRNNNKHNRTKYIEGAYVDAIIIGKETYGDINAEMTNSDAKLIIGNYCSIAKGVRFITCSDHRTDTLSTFPFHTFFLGEKTDAISKGDIIVEDDVWIGFGAIILSGIHIGQGAIIGAGAVVTKDVPPYSIVGGAPARVIRKRFSEDIIEYLLTLDYAKLDNALILNNINALSVPIEGLTKEDVIALYSWFPKR